MLEINIKEKDSCAVVELDGELNVKTSSEFEKHFNEIDGRKIIIDVEKLDYISTAGLRSLVILAKKLYVSKGAMIMCSLGQMVREIIEVSGFENLFKIFDSMMEAEKYFNNLSKK